MKKTFSFVLLVLCCICGYAQTIDPVLLQEMGQRSDDEKIKVVVIMKSQYDRQQLGRRAAHYTTRAARREFVVNELKQFAEATQYDLRHSLSEMERHDMTTAPKIIWMANALYFSATKQAINDLAERDDIEIIGFDEKKYALFNEEPRPANMTREIAPNVTQVNADQVWNMGYTGQGVVVAVIDTGVNYNHLDLADHLWDGGDEYPNHGYDFAYDDYDPMDDFGHGTHCAGTVCGDGTAGVQTGMAPDATLMCVKVLDSEGYGEVSVTCNGMQWAVEQGCDLFSMSLGWADASETERTLFRNTCAAVLDAGVIGAIAAGNEGGEWQWYFPIPYNVRVPGSCPPPYMDPIQENNPGGLSCAVCVGAVDEYDNAADFTSQGPVTWWDTEYADYPYSEGSTTEFGLIRPDVCAPGVDIISANIYDVSGYTYMSGTSMATPCVAGCISLLLSKNIDATPAEICQALEETAMPLEEGKSNTYGYGRVDALTAINSLAGGSLALESFAINDASGNNDGKLNAGESVAIDLSLTNVSDFALDGVTMELSTGSEYVTMTNGNATLPHFDVGQTQTVENVFSFSLSDDTPAKTIIRFIAEIFDDGEFVGNVSFNVTVYSHILQFVEVTVLNDDNGNGSLESGETANLHVVITNVGNEAATSVVGNLSTAFPYLTFNSNDKPFGSIEIGEQASANFNVSLSSSAPDGYTIDFLLDLVDVYAKHSELEFELWRKAITLTSNPVEGGTLSGGGNYGQGQTCVISATANDGYVFSKWTKNGTTVSYFPTYSFTVTEGAAYVANFKQVDGIVIGDAVSTNANLPISANIRYSMSQQIYTAAEMGGQSCQISSVSFFNTNYSSSRNLDVYMVHTNKTSFESETDWITVTEEDRVFSGNFFITSGNWVTIYFATPFEYDGLSNVALIVDNNSPNYYTSNFSHRTFNTVENQSIYISSSNTDYDPYNPTVYTGTLLTEKNQVVFGYARYEYTVTLTANPSEGGTVSGGEGLHYYGQPVTLTATPSEGYVFSKWTKNGSRVSCLSTATVQVTGNYEYVANFQQVDGIAIGEATYTNEYLPIHSDYPYSLSQQIYTADELNTEACEISSVSFFNVGYSEPRNLTIFMVNTDKTAFESSSDWITVTEADMVFSGSINTSYYDWTTIYFNTPFSYDGSSNVALVVNDESEEWGSNTSFRTFDAEGMQSIYVTRYYDSFDPYTPSIYSGIRKTVKNQIILQIPSYDYTVTLTADPEEGGTLSGGEGSYFYGQPITISATPNEGYVFNYWTHYNENSGNDDLLSYYSTNIIPVTESTEYVAHFQQMDGIAVGNSTHSSDFLPTFSESQYCMTQQIYTADELNVGACDISSVSFFNTFEYDEYSYYSYRYLSIYLVNTDKTAFENEWDWIAVDYEDQVFYGDVYMNGTGWTTIHFNSPFHYDGSSNVALVVCDETGDWGWGMSCRTYDSEGTQTLFTYDDGYWYGENFDPTYPYDYYGMLMSEKNEVVFGYYMVKVSAIPEEGGTVSGGGGPFDYGQNTTISATPNPGYVFNYWTTSDEYGWEGQIVSCLSTCIVSATGPGDYVAHFQQKDGIIIGDALTTSSYLPTYSNANYSLTQQIYTAAELSAEPCDISSVSFFNTNYSRTRSLDIYMVYTDKTSFESNNDWVAVTEDDKVFSGSVAMDGYGWTTIYFATPFAYDGTSNVVLVVDDNTNSVASYGIVGRTFGTENNQAIRISGSGTNYDPCSPSGYTGTLVSNKNQVIFGIATYEFMVSVSANPDEGGTVSGGGGPYYYGQPIPISAVPNPGYVFNKWTKNGAVASYLSTTNAKVTESAEYVANFQQMEGIAIGEAASISTYLPSSYYYSLTQQIFTASEMGGVEHEISCLSFFNTSYAITRNLDIYMVYTDKTSFESNTDWIAVTEDDKVFSGSVNISGNGWATIYFATPFTYDGVSNVALIVDDNTFNYNGLKCRTFDTEEYQAICVNSYGTNYDPHNPSSYTGTLKSEKNQVVFGFPHYEYMVTATSESTESGTVSGGGGPYYYGQPITLTAMANDGYAFVNWTKNGTVVSYLSPFVVSVTESADYVAHFQEIDGIVVGDAADTNSALPSFSYCNYSLSQQIYTADELGMGAGQIHSVSFFNTGSTRTRNYTIYMVSTNKASFNNETDWITVTTADKVFNGYVTMTAGNWTTISFDRQFDYDGTSNIALIVDDNTGEYYYPHMSCRVYSTDCSQAIYDCNDEVNYNPMHPSNYYGTLRNVKNQVCFGFTPTIIEQTVQLVQGWNWFSLFVEMDPTEALSMLEQGLGTHGLMIKARNGGYVEYDDEDNAWFGTLTQLTNENMYMIQMATACTVELQGIPAHPANHGITINPGWNWIGFPCNEEVSVMDAFASFAAEEDDRLKSREAYTEFDGDEWFGTLTTLVPGQGYMYWSESSETKTLIIQTGAKGHRR